MSEDKEFREGFVHEFGVAKYVYLSDYNKLQKKCEELEARIKNIKATHSEMLKDRNESRAETLQLRKENQKLKASTSRL